MYTKRWFSRVLLERLDPREYVKREVQEFYEPLRAIRKAWEEAEWTDFWEVLFPRGYSWFKRGYETIMNTVEFFRVLRALMLRQGSIVFIVQHRLFFPEKVRLIATERALLDLPPGTRERVIDILLQVARGRKITRKDLEEMPELMAFVERYIAYYMPNPCKHNAYVLRLTPITIRHVMGMKTTYYVLRWVNVGDMKADPYIGRSRPLSFSFSSIPYKPDWEVWSAIRYTGEGTGNISDMLTLVRDAVGQPTTRHQLRRIIYSPRWVRYEFAKELGKREIVTVTHHCSPYVRLERKSKTGRILDVQGDPRLMRRMRRKFVKELTYYMGLRA